VLPQKEIYIEAMKKAVGYAFNEKEYNGIKHAIADLGSFINKQFFPVAVSREVPLLVLNGEGSVVSGVIDLLIETDKGLWILDHKTDTAEDLEAQFGVYVDQLQAYKEAVEKAMKGKKVLGEGINWVRYGKLTLLEVARQ
jgi:ATP-dependent exoDNAse (exonuclease V) beta subunit